MSGPAPAITSLTNPRVKAAVRLRDRRERDATGLTIVDGARELLGTAGVDLGDRRTGRREQLTVRGHTT